jgi:hypothetical protein
VMVGNVIVLSIKIMIVLLGVKVNLRRTLCE